MFGCSKDSQQSIENVAEAFRNEMMRSYETLNFCASSEAIKLFIYTAMENGADSRDFGDGFRDALFRFTLF